MRISRAICVEALPRSCSSTGIGRIRFVIERLPGVWLWNVTVPLSGLLPMGSSTDLDTAKVEFTAAWEALKARTTPEQLAAAYKAMNIRDGG
jgi:hypothetical protein